MFLPALSKIWVYGEYETKLSLQKLLFPEGIVIDPNDRTYRTSNLNPIFRLIHSFTRGKDNSNKKQISKNTNPSCLVAGIGFIFPRCSEMGQKKKQPKETPIALLSDFFFCFQDDASIT